MVFTFASRYLLPLTTLCHVQGRVLTTICHAHVDISYILLYNTVVYSSSEFKYRLTFCEREDCCYVVPNRFFTNSVGNMYHTIIVKSHFTLGYILFLPFTSIMSMFPQREHFKVYRRT